MKAFLSASPCIFFENETLFHEGENSWAGREKSSHFSILKEKNTLSSPTLLRLFWNFVYVQISVFPLSPSWVRDSLLGKEGGINTYGGVGGGGCLLSFFSLPFACRFLFLMSPPSGDVSQSGRMRDGGGGGVAGFSNQSVCRCPRIGAGPGVFPFMMQELCSSSGNLTYPYSPPPPPPPYRPIHFNEHLVTSKNPLLRCAEVSEQRSTSHNVSRGPDPHASSTPPHPSAPPSSPLLQANLGLGGRGDLWPLDSDR
jgi:hypothetical protein